MTKQKDFKTSMKGLWLLTRPNVGRIAVRCALGIVRIAASLTFVWVCKSLVDIVTGQSDLQLWSRVAIMLGVMLVQYATGLAASYYEGIITIHTTSELRSSTFEHVMRSRWAGRESYHSGDIVSRLEEDVQVVVDLVCSRFPDIVITILQLVAASCYLLTLAPGLAWLLIGLMVVAVVGSKMFFRTIRRLSMEIREKESGVQGYVQENVLHRAVSLTLSGLERVVKRMNSQQDEVIDKTVSRLRFGIVARGFMSLGFAAGYASAFLWGIFGIRSGAVTFGMMTAFLQLVSQVQGPIANLSRHVPAFIHALTSVDRVVELFELPEERYSRPDLLEGTPGIRVNSLSFVYPDGHKKVLDTLMCDFKPGTITAIMGETGAGKSTLMRLLLALLHPAEGSIELYNEVRTVSVSADTRCNFMYVPQGNSLMSGTLRQNFQMADPDATDEDMKDALHTAAADFVFDLPEGLDTLCSEEGGGFSEGQAQRIAIARALLHSGGIMILDESTSALDAVTEQTILQNLHERCRGRKTILFVSHRETVSDWADSVLSL